MNVDLGPEGEAFRREIAAFLDERLTPEVRERVRRSGSMHDWELHRALAAGGPREYGGQGRSPLELMAMREELKKRHAPTEGMGMTLLVPDLAVLARSRRFPGVRVGDPHLHAVERGAAAPPRLGRHVAVKGVAAVGPKVSVIPNRFARDPGSPPRRRGGDTAGRLPGRSDDRSASANRGWEASRAAWAGQPRNSVARSRTSRSNVASGSGTASVSSVASAVSTLLVRDGNVRGED